MLQRITADDPIWNEPPFEEEKALFSLLFSLREYVEPLIVTDRERIFAAQSSPDMPAWVWTHADASPDLIRALCSVFKITKMTAKESVLHALRGEWKVTCRLLANVCNDLVIPSHVDGFSDKPRAVELPRIAEGIKGFQQEATQKTISGEDAMKAAERFLQEPDFTVWKTESNELAAFAMVRHWTKEYARINRVYTYPHFRGRGYAGATVATLCARIIAKGAIPMLYTNADYPSSNRAYRKIGFKPIGELSTFYIFDNVT